MSTHLAVVTTAIRAPIDTIQVPTITPVEREVLVHVEWTASGPLDLHQNDGGLFVKHPQVLGDNIAGTVVEVGGGVRNLKPGDKVFGFGWREQKEKAQQEYATVPEYLLGKLPHGFTLQEAVTLPNNFVTVFHTVTVYFGIPLPWPQPDNYHPPHAEDVILIWGGSSSVGQYALQILSYYGYRNLLATASAKHDSLLKSFGARHVFDYRQADVTTQLLAAAEKLKSNGPPISFVLDCIGSQSGSLAPIAKIAQNGSKVAILLPVTVQDATDTIAPKYTMDVQTSVDWEPGVTVMGVRTHFYLDNPFFKEHLQPDIMTTMLANGSIMPNKQRIIEGSTLKERVQKALDSLRRKEASGERLVWRVAE